MRNTVRLVALMLIACNGFHASAQEIINYFEVADNIAKPVIIMTNLGTFKIYGGERIDGNLYRLSAYDANGNQIVNTTPYSVDIGTNKPTIRRYKFKDLYKKSSSSAVQSSSSSGEWGSELGAKFGNAVARATAVPMDGFPNLQVRAGASLVMGEYLSVKTELGSMGGLSLSAGIGKNIFSQRATDNNWFVSIGAYIGVEGFSFSYDMGIMQRHYYDDYWNAGYSDLVIVCGSLEFSYFFNEGRFGAYANLQAGIGGGDSFVFNASIGLSWKLLSK